MIRASPALTLGQAATYYHREYTRGDYYTADRATAAGTWQGRAAARLGLAGPVDPADFAALLAGRAPRHGRQLVAPQTATGKHRAAWDFQAAPHKSVSLLALVAGDDRIVLAHLAAARTAFDVLEEHALVKDRARRPVPTGNLILARFDHDSSRALDPHLHSHHVIFNLTERAPRTSRAGAAATPAAGGGEWRALEPRGLFAAQALATAAYHTELARHLQALGYPVEADAQGLVRIAGIPDTALQAFSKRSRQILAELERRGRTDPAARQRAALYTRPRKNRDVDPAALRAAWRAEAARHGLDLDALRRAAESRCQTTPAHPAPPAAAPDPTAQARAAVAWAVDHLAERQAAFRAMDLETYALRHAAARGPGHADVRAALATHPGLLRGAAGLLTTRAALRLEQANLARVRAALLPTAAPVLARPYTPGPASTLGADQLRVVRHLLESRAQLLGVEGKPGTGKTFTLKTVREAAEHAGWTVRGFAATTGAVAQLHDVGIQAATLKSLAARPPAPHPLDAPTPRQLWIVDEASLLGNRDAAVILESAHRAGARLVLLGDRRQHHGVEAGAPWRAFQTAGLRPVQLDLIRRQKHTDLLAAVQLSAAGRAALALRHLDARGHVIEIPAARDRHAAMVKDLLKAPGDPRHTLLIAPSRAERRDLNFLARRELLAAGRIAPHPLAVEIAVSKGATAAQRTDLRHYAPGDLIHYPRAAPAHGLRAGDTARVLAIDPDRHTVRVERHRDHQAFEYDPRRLRGGDLSTLETRDLAAGDRIQFRRADRTRGIPNGATATVKEATPAGRLVLALEGRGGRTVTLDTRTGPLAIDYAYAVTSHAAQGATVRRVLATFDTRHPADLVNRQQANVTLSRASHHLTVYTDNRAALPAAVDRDPRKTTALETQPTRRTHPHAPTPPTRPVSRTPRTAQPAAPDPTRRPARSAPIPSTPIPGTPGPHANPRPARHRSGEPLPPPRRRPRARAGGQPGRPHRPRHPRPHPHPLRHPRPHPRSERAPQQPRRPDRAPDRPAPLRRDRRPFDPRDPARDRAPSQPRHPFKDPLARRLTHAVERWQQAQARSATVPTAAHVAAGLAFARAVAAGEPEDPERHLLRLLKEVGIRRALALLPPPLAQAVRTLREVGRLLAPTLDR